MLMEDLTSTTTTPLYLRYNLQCKPFLLTCSITCAPIIILVKKILCYYPIHNYVQNFFWPWPLQSVLVATRDSRTLVDCTNTNHHVVWKIVLHVIQYEERPICQRGKNKKSWTNQINATEVQYIRKIRLHLILWIYWQLMVVLIMLFQLPAGT